MTTIMLFSTNGVYETGEFPALHLADWIWVPKGRTYTNSETISARAWKHVGRAPVFFWLIVNGEPVGTWTHITGHPSISVGDTLNFHPGTLTWPVDIKLLSV